MRRVATDALDAYASAEMVQEFVHHRLRRHSDHVMAAMDGHDLAAMIKLLDYDAAVLELSLDLSDAAPMCAVVTRFMRRLPCCSESRQSSRRILPSTGIGGIVRADPRAVAAS